MENCRTWFSTVGEFRQGLPLWLLIHASTRTLGTAGPQACKGTYLNFARAKDGRSTTSMRHSGLRLRALAIIIAGSSPADDRKVDLADRGSQVFLRR
jgi:hypothetical protein